MLRGVEQNDRILSKQWNAWIQHLKKFRAQRGKTTTDPRLWQSDELELRYEHTLCKPSRPGKLLNIAPHKNT